MKKYIQSALSHLARSQQLDAINTIASARRAAMGTHSSVHSKEMYLDAIEQSKELRSQHIKDKKSWNRK